MIRVIVQRLLVLVLLLLAVSMVTFGAMNVVGGYVVTDRMLRMFRKKPTAPKADSEKEA